MNIKFMKQEDEYSSVLASMLAMEFPGAVKNDPCATFEAVVAEIVGTKQHRFGPTPSPEVLVTIRDVVRKAMEARAPIPVLIPWGGSKQGDYGLDLAELFALKQVASLRRRVARHYEPGVNAAIRVEDATDRVLFYGYGLYDSKIREYSSTLMNLSHIVDPDVDMKLESELLNMTQSGFHFEVSEAAVIIDGVMQGRKGLAALEAIGWVGGLPDEQVKHYRKAYAKMYPTHSKTRNDMIISEYFAASLIRRKRNATGAPVSETAPILLCFSKPVPAVNQDRRVYYRTLPERFQNTHHSPWMAKGYAKIVGREAYPAIGAYDVEKEFKRQTLMVEGRWGTVAVQADYEVAF